MNFPVIRETIRNCLCPMDERLHNGSATTTIFTSNHTKIDDFQCALKGAMGYVVFTPAAVMELINAAMEYAKNDIDGSKYERAINDFCRK